MTHFLDGPAQGKTLMLKRTPKYLRVVVDAKGDIDALDQLEDVPRPEESVFAYRLHEHKGAVHLNTGRGPGGGFYQACDFKLIPNQPADAVLRSTKAWQQWTVETEARIA